MVWYWWVLIVLGAVLCAYGFFLALVNMED
jgi:hypothetical protein